MRAAGPVGLGGQRDFPAQLGRSRAPPRSEGKQQGLPPGPIAASVQGGAGRLSRGRLGSAGRPEGPAAPLGRPPRPPGLLGSGWSCSTSLGPAAEGRALARPTGPPAERGPRPGRAERAARRSGERPRSAASDFAEAAWPTGPGCGALEVPEPSPNAQPRPQHRNAAQGRGLSGRRRRSWRVSNAEAPAAERPLHF